MSGDQSAFLEKQADKKIVIEMDNVEDVLESTSSIHKRLLFTRLAELRKDSQLCDVVLAVKEERISAHRVVLAASSNYFKTLFTRNMTEDRLQEVYLGNMEASVVDALVKFCYSGEINISNANVMNILSAARLFQLDQVEELCREFLKRKLEPSSSLAVRPVTDSISCPEADENVLHNFENAVNTEKAHEILVNQLAELILNEELSVRLMAQIVNAVLRWIRSDLSARKQFLSESSHSLQLSAPERLSKQLLSTHQKDSPKFREVLYVVGGYGGEYFNFGEKFPVWRRIPSMSITREYAGVAALDDLLYVVGGLSNGKRVNSAERFDPVANEWSSDIAPMRTCRSSVGVTVLNGFLYASGGFDDSDKVLDTVERYDPQQKEWVRVAPMGTRRYAHSVSVLDGYLYAIGGHDEESTVNTVERFDPRTGRWEFVRPMSTCRQYLGSAVLDGHLYAAGGGDESSHHLSSWSVEKYNPLTDEWTEVAAMKEKRWNVKLVVANEKLYAVGGHGTSDQSSVEVFDPKTNTWAIHSYLNERREGAGVGVIRMPLP